MIASQGYSFPKKKCRGFFQNISCESLSMVSNKVNSRLKSSVNADRETRDHIYSIVNHSRHLDTLYLALLYKQGLNSANYPI